MNGIINSPEFQVIFDGLIKGALVIIGIIVALIILRILHDRLWDAFGLYSMITAFIGFSATTLGIMWGLCLLGEKYRVSFSELSIIFVLFKTENRNFYFWAFIVCAVIVGILELVGIFCFGAKGIFFIVALYISGLFISLAVCTVLGMGALIGMGDSVESSNNSYKNTSSPPIKPNISHGDCIYDINTHETFNVLSVSENGNTIHIMRNQKDIILYRTSNLYSDNDGNWYKRS
ncbi:MAG: hypothetical protein IJ192_02560 [Clostridia bacterium]|nr:hypothetical protein [Clostridia bacterium]